MKKYIIYNLLLIVIFNGCEDGVDVDSDVTTVKTGTFIDAPVYGLHYKTATQEGYTNSKGEFNYNNGEIVEFKLGNLSLGKIKASELITPYSLAGVSIGTENNKVSNITSLLQNLNKERTNQDIINISKLKDYNFSDINFSVPSSDMETEIASILVDNLFQEITDENNYTLIPTEDTLINMNQYLGNYLLENTNKFNTLFLDGKIYYTLTSYGDNNTLQLITITFTKSTVKFTTQSNLEDTFNYDINDKGQIHWIENEKNEYLTISSKEVQGFILMNDSRFNLLYINKEEAENALAGLVPSVSITLETGFTQEWLDSKGVMYSLYRGWDEEKQEDINWTVSTVKFENENLFETKNSFVDLPALSNITYTIEADGRIKENNSNDIWYDKIIGITDDYLESCTMDINDTLCEETSKGYIYFDKEKAKVKLDQLIDNN